MVTPAFSHQLDAVFFEIKRDLLECKIGKVSCNNFPSFYLTLKIESPIEDRKIYPIKCYQLIFYFLKFCMFLFLHVI